MIRVIATWPPESGWPCSARSSRTLKLLPLLVHLLTGVAQTGGIATSPGLRRLLLRATRKKWVHYPFFASDFPRLV